MNYWIRAAKYKYNNDYLKQEVPDWLIPFWYFPFFSKIQVAFRRFKFWLFAFEKRRRREKQQLLKTRKLPNKHRFVSFLLKSTLFDILILVSTCSELVYHDPMSDQNKVHAHSLSNFRHSSLLDVDKSMLVLYRNCQSSTWFFDQSQK